MLSQDSQLSRRARMLKHARRDAPKNLKARSPQLLPGAGDDDDDDDDGKPTTERTSTTRRPTTTTEPATTRSPTTSKEEPTLTTRPSSTAAAVTTPATTATSTAPTTTSSSSTSSITTRSTRTSSSTTSSATPTTSSSTSALTTSSHTTSAATRVVSTSTSSLSSTTGTASSATASSTPSSGVSTAGIIGITGAAIVGAAVLIGIIMFFVRRWNRKEDKFDPDAFKRQSTLLRDDNSSLHRGNSNGHAPRPPTMFERHNQNVAAFTTSNLPPSAGYGSSAHYYNGPGQFNDLAGSPPMALAPGVYAPVSAASPASSTQFSNGPSFFDPAYQASPPVGAYAGADYAINNHISRSPSNGAPPMLNRNNSVGHPQYPYYGEEPEYADVNRTSVTPFQAAQYEAISKQLNIPPPKPLHQVAEGDEDEELPNPNEETTPTPDMEPKLVSPFEDPLENNMQSVHDAAKESTGARPSSEIRPAEPVARVTSTPPSLPEIQMPNGSFSPVNMSFPVTPSPRQGSFDIQSGRASPKVDLPPLSPVTSSPQRARFVDGIEARAHDGHETPVEIGFIGDDAGAVKGDVHPPVQQKSEDSKVQATKRPDTVYDVEDAYGGI